MGSFDIRVYVSLVFLSVLACACAPAEVDLEKCEELLVRLEGITPEKVSTKDAKNKLVCDELIGQNDMGEPLDFEAPRSYIK